MTKKLTLIRGIMGSGKSTLAKSIGAVFFEADMFFIEDGEYKFDGEKNGAAHQWCRIMTSTAMAQRTKHIVVSNTFRNRRELKDYLLFALGNGYDVEIVETVHEYGSIHNLPEETLQRFRDNYVPNSKLDLVYWKDAGLNVELYNVEEYTESK